MAPMFDLLKLPDLVIYKICECIQNPFDLLNFGSTCSRLQKITSLPSLWWPLAIDWCQGFWLFTNFKSENIDPRLWFLEFLKHNTIPSPVKEREWLFDDDEKWTRIESLRFRCIFGLLRLAYKKEKEDNPAVLYEQWLYDLGLFSRIAPSIDFAANDFNFSKKSIASLSSLGQAVERDLRRRKQPFKDPKYYIKRVAISFGDWMNELFPSGPHGSICPLLMCPFQDAFTTEISGLPGLAMCLSLVLGRILKIHYKTSFLPLTRVVNIVKLVCRAFIDEILEMMPEIESRFGPYSLRTCIITLVAEKKFPTEHMQSILNSLDLNIKFEDIILNLSNLLEKYNGIDTLVDAIRRPLRKALFDEINSVLGIDINTNYVVTRLNLTDSDLIGGDNSKQEMASAAFITHKGVLVTWHLTGRMRF